MASAEAKQASILAYLTPKKIEGGPKEGGAEEPPTEGKTPPDFFSPPYGGQHGRATSKGKKFSVKQMLDDTQGEERRPLPLPNERKRGQGSQRQMAGKWEASSGLTLLSIVWAKFSRYPPWPAIVCYDKTSDAYVHADGRVHVQFFDEGSTHAWVDGDKVVEATLQSLNDVLGKSKRGRYSTSLAANAKAALAACELSAAKRLALIVDQNSDVDNNNDLSSLEDDDDKEEEEEEEYEPDVESNGKRKRPASGWRNKKLKVEYSDTVAAGKDVASANHGVNDKNEHSQDTEDTEDAQSQGGEEDDEREEAEPELCEYERIRQRNIEERQKMLERIKREMKEELLPSPYNSRKSTSISRRGLAAKKENAPKEPKVATRKSLRLQNQPADESKKLPEVEPSAYGLTDERPRPSLGPLKLEEVVRTEDVVEEQCEWLRRQAVCASEEATLLDGRPASFGKKWTSQWPSSPST